MPTKTPGDTDWKQEVQDGGEVMPNDRTEFNINGLM